MLQSERSTTENYLLTLASRLSNTQGVVVIVAEADGRFTNHQANFGELPWVTVAGNVAAVQHDILSNKVSWEPVNIDGSDQSD